MAKPQAEASCFQVHQDSQPGKALSSSPRQLPDSGLGALPRRARAQLQGQAEPGWAGAPAAALAVGAGCQEQAGQPARSWKSVTPPTPRMGSLGPARHLWPEDKSGIYLQGSL